VCVCVCVVYKKLYEKGHGENLHFCHTHTSIWSVCVRSFLLVIRPASAKDGNSGVGIVMMLFAVKSGVRDARKEMC
jgi:hypothetical protein